MAIKITAKEYEKKFGTPVVPDPKQGIKANFSLKDGFNKVIADPIKNAFKGGVDQVKQGFEQAGTPRGPVQGFESSLKIGSGVASAVFSPLAPVFKPVEKAINFAGDKISNNKNVQKFADSKAGQVTSRVAEDVANAANIAGAVGGSKYLTGEVPKFTPSLPKRLAPEEVAMQQTHASNYLKNAVKDITPTTEGIINHQVTKALDLTAADVKNISMSTGNEVGTFLAEKNLIGENKATTVANITKFFEENYNNVRGEIAKVQTPYKVTSVPRYVEALKAIQKKVDSVPGLQKISVEVDNLLNKKTPTLSDVQRVKELMDDHFSLYKATGDVSEGVAKEGLANIRKDIQQFIEQEVEKNTGAKIGEMNNNVSTAKGVMDAVEARSTAGLTRSNLKLGDFGAFGIGMTFGGPVGGLAALFLKKLSESPSIQLRIAKFLDGISDARKASIKAELEAGKIPQDFQQFVKQGRGGPGAMAKGELERLPTIHAEDKAFMQAYIDSVRLKKPNPELELDAHRIAQHYGIKSKLTPSAMANAFDETLSRLKQNYAPKPMSFPK